MVDRLLERPYFTIPPVVRFLGVSYPTAKAIAETLVRVGIAREMFPGDQPRVFVATDIVAVLNRPFRAAGKV